MFDFLKKKISSFTQKVSKKVEEKAIKEKKVPEKKERIEKPAKEKIKPKEEFEEELSEEEREVLEEIRKEDEKQKLEKEKEKLETEKQEEIEEIIAEEKEIEAVEEKGLFEEIKEEHERAGKKTALTEKEKIVWDELEGKVEEEALEEELGEKAEEEKRILPKLEISLEETKPEAKLSKRSQLKTIFAREVSIEERDIEEFLEEFELALLESDVEQETSQEIVAEIRKEIVGKKIPKKVDLNDYLKMEIKKVLEKIMFTETIDFEKTIDSKKPFVILFLGPNGAGKTTSIAKLTHFAQARGKTVLWAAADTFRAASIEQLEKHASKLGVRVVKHAYNADPTAVAFDAVQAAIAAKIDLVFIDSAGRQDTNKNLMNELKKIDRVIKPDLKIFVGEAMAGNALLEQAKQFHEWIGLSGFILTKIDTDTKGGTSISLLHKIKKPILFIGIGQEYKDLIKFTPDYIIDKIIE